MIKPNKQEVKVLLIALSLVIGFCIGVFSVSPQVKEKNERIDELKSLKSLKNSQQNKWWLSLNN